MNILDYIPEGHENAVTLNYLIGITGYKGREIRAYIEKNNIVGDKPIVNLMDGKGYFIPTTEETDSIKRYIISEKSRARKLEKKIRSLERYLCNIGQEEMIF